MTLKPVIRRQQAEADFLEAVRHYLGSGGASLALRFAQAFETAIDALARHPAAGSLRYADWLRRPGLRFRQTHRFPYLIFYVQHADRFDVLRVLHGSRDMPAMLREIEFERTEGE